MDQRELFARSLNESLKKNGMSQKDLALEMNLTQSTVSDWCLGKKYPRVETAQRIADVLGVPYHYLMGFASDFERKLTDDEKDLLRIFRKLDRREKHKIMALAYELEERGEG